MNKVILTFKIIFFALFLYERAIFYSQIVDVKIKNKHLIEDMNLGFINIEMQYNNNIKHYFEHAIDCLLDLKNNYFIIFSILYDLIITIIVFKNLFSNSCIYAFILLIDSIFKLVVLIYYEYKIGSNIGLDDLDANNLYYKFEILKFLKTFFRFFILTYIDNSWQENISILSKLFHDYITINIAILSFMIIFWEFFLLLSHNYIIDDDEEEKENTVNVDKKIKSD
jgi:hypothetical protein